MIKIILTIILLTTASFASADYTVFELNPIPVNQPIGSVNDYQMVGFSDDGFFRYIEYNTDATVTQFDRITLPLCRSGGANGGEIYLEVRSTATSGPIVASSTLAVNSGNVWNTGCASTIINATTSTFVLNQNVQWLTGGTFWFTIKAVGTTGTFYLSFDVNNGSGAKFYGVGTPPTWLGQFYYTSMTGYALGIPPVVYSASSSNVSCGTFDVGCYISTAISFLFYPEDWTFDQLNDLQDQLASTTPFGYGYELVSTVNTALATGTSSFELTADLSDFGTVFQNATSVPIVSSEGIINFIGDDWDMIQNVLITGLYLMLLSYFWKRFFSTI